MVRVVGVRFKKTGKIYYFDPFEMEISVGEAVIVETARGVEYGTVVIGPREVPDDDLYMPLKPVIRIAAQEDKDAYEENIKRAEEAMPIFIDLAEKHELPMRLVDCEYTFDGSKMLFYFTAEGRIDFRDLVKDLAATFRTRIELRQIGVRDQAKLVGGLGCCGNICCCKRFMGDFNPVSIKMAKDQNLSLNPTKISGICGRLMCCLKYEQDAYEDIIDRMPPTGSLVKTPDGTGTVIGARTIEEKVLVKIKEDDDSFSENYYKISELQLIQKSDQRCRKTEEYNDADEELLSELESD